MVGFQALNCSIVLPSASGGEIVPANSSVRRAVASCCRMSFIATKSKATGEPKV